MTGAHLTSVELPEFGMPQEMPVIPDSVYRARLESFEGPCEGAGL